MMMNFSSAAAFFQMGGYAAYVWPAYAIVVFVLCYQFIFVSGRLRRQLKKLKKKYVAEA